MIQVSVIVPVYNAGECIHRCLNSLANQYGVDMEIILVDDGSTDGSGEICRNFAETHSNTRYVRKQNGGAGPAKQTGLEISNGEYVFFSCDDDIIEPNALSVLYKAAKKYNADLAAGDILYEDWASLKSPRVSRLRVESNTLCFPAEDTDLIYKLRLFSFNKLIRRSVLTDNDIIHPAHIYEDVAETPCIIASASSVVYIKYPVYRYCTNRPGSADYKGIQLEYLFQSVKEMTEYFKYKNLWTHYYNSLLIMINSQYRFLVRKAERICNRPDLRCVIIEFKSFIQTEFPTWVDTSDMNITVIGSDRLKTAADNFVVTNRAISFDEPDENTDLIIMDNTIGFKQRESISDVGCQIYFVNFADNADYIFPHGNVRFFNVNTNERDEETLLWNIADDMLKSLFGIKK